jgi:MFS family permease
MPVTASLDDTNMKQAWFKCVLPIAAIFSFRMLGLFMLIPVFSVYATHLSAATPALIGIALGCYGLSQGLLQIPFGMLSDRYGRKSMITIGLLLFAFGSLLGAYTDSIYGMIIARTLQGTGAIGSVLIALLADLTHDNDRTKAMAVIGVTIGFSFSLAMVISPIITNWFGFSAIFYLTAVLAGLGLLLLHTVIPTPAKEPFHSNRVVNLNQLKEVFSNRHLQRLDIGIFCQHLILTSTFFAVPMLLQHYMKQGVLSQPSHFYLPLMVSAFLMMVPFIIFAEKKHRMKGVFVLSVAFTALAQLILAFTYTHWSSLCILLFAYFVAFNVLEATLPSLVSKQAPAHVKGTAMGIYSSSQFLGIFAGGTLSGIIYQLAGAQGVFLVNAVIALLWFVIALYMNPNLYQFILRIPCSAASGTLIKTLRELPGVEAVVFSLEEKTIFLHINKMTYQNKSAEAIISDCSAL